MKEREGNPEVISVDEETKISGFVVLVINSVIAFFLSLAVCGLVGSARDIDPYGRYDHVPPICGWLAFIPLWVGSSKLIHFLLARQDRVDALLSDSNLALDLSSNYLHGHGVIKSRVVADEYYMKAVTGLKQVAKVSKRSVTCFECATILERLAEPGGFVAYPETKFKDRSHVAATFLRAALLGSRPSQLKVAQLYQEGFGFARDLTEAYAWFNICAAHGNVEAERSRESLATSMSQAEIAKAQQRSQELFAMVNGRN